MSKHNFTVRYRPGIVNKDADCLPRLPLDINRYIRECIETAVQVQQHNGETWYLNNKEHNGNTVMVAMEFNYKMVLP